MRKSKFFVLTIFTFLAFSQIWAQRKSEDFVTVYSGEITTLNYLISSSTNEHAMFANMLDNLVEYDKYGVLQPCLAESWVTSADGLVWTFKLRKGVKWMNYKAEAYAEVTAQDWVTAAKYIMTKANASKVSEPLVSYVKNGKEFYEGSITNFDDVGVKALDAYTLQYTLSNPCPYFLSMLTYVTYLPVNSKFLAETGATFGRDHKTILANGAYIMIEFEPQTSRTLVKNAKYWDAKNVNIPKLLYRYNKEAATLSPELFIRGQCSYATIPTAMVDTWMKDSTKKLLIHPALTNTYTYFFGFNFKPTFAAEYEPFNWAVAVNNKNFRKALFHALDRKAAMLTSEPHSPERRIQSTITPRGFAAAAGYDYTMFPPLAALAVTESFNVNKALAFKAEALKELAGKATFPVKIMMPYNSGITEAANRVQVIEQQMEAALGKDFIDIIPVSFPPTGYLGATRRAGNYAMQELNWGPDYADPQTYTDPFISGGTYIFLDNSTAYKRGDGKTTYDTLVEAAINETGNIKKRYELFAKAESFLIEEAFIIPYGKGGGGFEASKLEPFCAPYAPFGLSSLKFKWQVVMPKPLTTAQYTRLENEWDTAREKALQKAKY